MPAKYRIAPKLCNDQYVVEATVDNGFTWEPIANFDSLIYAKNHIAKRMHQDNQKVDTWFLDVSKGGKK